MADRLNEDRDALERNELRDETRRGMEGDEARLTLSEEQLAVGKRSREAGEVDIGKHVETEHVRQSVPTMHEEVTIERRPLDGMNTAGATIGEEHLSVPLREEEVVAEKRVVPREEILAHKREVVETEQVDATLRREELDVDRQGDVEIRGDAPRGRR
jgi:uncharacterized protein (TIGR02271 family)